MQSNSENQAECAEDNDAVGLLEDVKNKEEIFLDYKLAFDIACVLAEATEEGEGFSVNQIADLLDSPSEYLCESEKDLQDLVLEIILSFNQRYRSNGFIVKKVESGVYQLKGGVFDNLKNVPIKPLSCWENKRMSPKNKLFASVASETRAKIKSALKNMSLERNKKVITGELIEVLLEQNYPNKFSATVGKMKKELETLQLPSREETKRISLNNSPSASKKVYMIARELNIKLGTAIDLIVHPLPLLELDENGEY